MPVRGAASPAPDQSRSPSHQAPEASLDRRARLDILTRVRQRQSFQKAARGQARAQRCQSCPIGSRSGPCRYGQARYPGVMPRPRRRSVDARRAGDFASLLFSPQAELPTPRSQPLLLSFVQLGQPHWHSTQSRYLMVRRAETERCHLIPNCPQPPRTHPLDAVLV